MKQESMNPEQYQGFERDWAITAVHFSSALQNVALELGGSDYADRITKLAGDDWWPDAAALEEIEERSPGSIERLFELAETAQKTAHEQEVRQREEEAKKRLREARRSGVISGFENLFNLQVPLSVRHEKRQ